MAKRLNGANLNKLVSEALAIEAQDAKEAGAIGFMARALVQATMPHKDPGDVEAWGRENGTFSMVMQPGVIKKGHEFKKIGLPYGTYPRLLLAWLSTEAVRTKGRTLVLGHSLSSFMRQLDLIPAGGRWGTISRLKEQMRRLFSAFITCSYENNMDKDILVNCGRSLNVASSYELWWSPQNPEQAGLWQSTVTLGDEFFKEIINRPVPIDMRALKALKGSAMRLDIYTWLTYRMSYLKKTSSIPWQALQMQFGADFGRTIDFKTKFKEHLKAVLVVYPEAKVEVESTSLILRPSKPHIPLPECR
jgi:hypothetical protein